MIVRTDTRLVPPARVIEDLGVDGQGAVQRFLTDRVLFRMRRYMPWLTGFTATSLTQATGAATITVSAPYARYLYFGVSASGNPLDYTRTENPLAGPYWDRTLAQNEGAAIAEEATDYARSLR